MDAVRILVADDSSLIRDGLKRGLEKEGFVVETVETPDEMLERIGQYVIYLCDGFNGRCMEIITELESRGMANRVIVFSANTSLKDEVEERGCIFIPKPASTAFVATTIRQLIKRIGIQ